MAILIDGKKTSSEIKEELKKEILLLINQGKQVPGLVTILVGENPASQSYVTSKSKSCIEIGMLSKVEKLSESVSETELLKLIDHYNKDDNYH